MSEHIIGNAEGEPAVVNLALLGATVPDLLSELERKGVDIPAMTFQLVQGLSELRNQRWQAMSKPKYTAHPLRDGSCEVHDLEGKTVAHFFPTDNFDAYEQGIAFTNPTFTDFERAAEIAGEVGELVNAAKKLRRHDIGYAGNYKNGEQDRDELMARVAYEIGDVYVTCFNLCNKLHIDAWNCLRHAFNTKSDEMGFPEKL